ncbi:carbamoyltransferase C-terminal domain-containing protein [Xenorhabdus doucetiae]|uniref:Carbamoyltransferase n=1 Tax=Xenorhabdus doucetiae TaxID=351671 RepID=A0A068QUL1_9GAMM|nr:carbamoyltransferase C-terminal domain-containing protein [Xenorhabdus doucetiae]TYP13136.1 carbamoyltransferase [Xenorhabdus doucetiae]CDG18668.1 Carbamoyltransferase [Xenorhabdus doucetiae]
MKEIVLAINIPILADGTVTYDGNVVLADRNKVIMAIAEERVSKEKYDGKVTYAVKETLERNNLTLSDISAISVVSFGQPMTDLDMIDDNLKKELDELFPDFNNIHIVKSHHSAHALSAISQTDIKRALVVVADHTGNIIGERTDPIVLENNAAEQVSYYLYENDDLHLIAQDNTHPCDQGYGRFYGDVTCYLGFDSYRESGKTMGLASFGDPDVFSDYSPFIETDTGVVSALINEDYTEDCTKDIQSWFKKQGIDIPDRRTKSGVIRPFDMHLAAWAQEQLHKSIIHRVKGLIDKYNVDTLCVVGGVAMNSVMNRKLEEELNITVYVPPSPGDAGLALGAAADYFWKKDNSIPKFNSSPYLGPIYSEDEIAKSVRAYEKEFIIKRINDPEHRAAHLIADGKVIGWFQDRSEYGPRALGNRSILALPSNSWTKEILNSQIKLREWFRPYAPVVLEEDADNYFDMLSPVSYMMKVAPVKARAKLDMPACIHVDGTARLQTVSSASNQKFYNLIQELKNITGVPVVLNTSFNLAGMPIVESPIDAINCFRKAIGMYALFIGNYML